MKHRLYYLDILRILACAMVVLMHSPIPSENANSILLSTISYLTAPCIGLFFMVSGALLIPTTLSAKDFIKRRLDKIIIPTLFWTVVYIILNLAFTDTYKTQTDLSTTILSIPFSAQGHGVLWFMYTLIGFYLVIPIISPWILKATENEKWGYLILFTIPFLYPFLSLILKIDDSTTGILYYFTGYGSYFIWGYMMRNYGFRIRPWVILVATFLAIASPIVVYLLHLQVDFYSLFWYLSLPVLIMCIAWWKGFAVLSDKINRLSQSFLKHLTALSGMTFGIYLCHIAIMRFFIWNVPFVANINNYALQTVIVFLATFSLSWLFVYLCSLTRLGRKLTAYTK